MMRTNLTTSNVSAGIRKALTLLLLISLLLCPTLSSVFLSRESEAAGLLPHKSLSKAGEVKVRVDREQGLYRIIFSVTGIGTIYVNLPDDMAAGDVVTGTLFAEPDGKGGERDKNLHALQKFVVGVDGKKIPASEKTFRLAFRPTSKAAPVVIQLLDDKGKVAASQEVSDLPQQPRASKEVLLPPYGQTGRIFAVACACDGVLADTDYVKVGGKQILTLAESPRQRAALNTSEFVGPTQIEISERGQVTKGAFRNISLKMTASKLSLLRGEQATMRVEVRGLENLEEELPLRLENRSTSVLTMSGADVQALTIRPSDVQAGGVYTTERTLTGVTVGPFLIEGVITWKRPEESATFDREKNPAVANPGASQSESTQSADALEAKWPTELSTTAEARGALKSWQEKLPQPKAPENPLIKVQAVEPTPAMLSRLVNVVNSDNAPAAMLSQQFDEKTFMGTLYSAILVHKYMVAESDHKRLTSAGKTADSQWPETVSAFQKAFALAGLPGLGEDKLSQYAKQLATNQDGLRAVTKLVNSAQMIEEPGEGKAPTDALAQFVPATAKLIGPSTNITIRKLCDEPIAQGTFTKHFGDSFPLTVRLHLPCIPKFWKWCWYSITIASVSYSLDLNVGYKVNCCGATAWGQAVAQACVNVFKKSVCAGCSGAIVGVAGIGKSPATGGDCMYGLGINASLQCTFGGSTLYSASATWGHTVTGPCPPSRLPCRLVNREE